MSPSKNLPSILSPIKTIENGHGQRPTNFKKFENSLRSPVGIHEKFVPNVGLHLGFMPLLLVEHLVVPLHPNGPKSNISEEMPNFDHLAEFVRDPFTKNCLFSIETIKVAGSNSAQFVHNIGGPPPNLLACIQFQNLCLNHSLVLGRQKIYCLEMLADTIRALQSFTATALCQMDQMKATQFPLHRGSHTCDQKN